MYISKLRIKNWRNFTKAEVDLREIVYLIGPNASGKSNFLDIFRFMRDLVNPSGGGLQRAVSSRGGLTKIRSLAARRYSQVELDMELRESLDDVEAPADWRYVLAIKNEPKRHRPIVASEEVYKEGESVLNRPENEDEEDPERLTQTHLEQINMNRDFREIADYFKQVLYLHLVPQLLKFSDQFSAARVESDPFGQGFLEEIARAAPRTRDSRLRKIEDILLKVVPNFDQLKFVKDTDTGRPHLQMLYNHWRPKAGWQREDQFSDGTLRMIALIWTLLTSNNMILLEEPELSLHEAVVRQIPDLFHKTRQSRKKSGGQILISTHSEAMLSSKSIAGRFLMLQPGLAGEATKIVAPTEKEIAAMRAGLSPADVLLPKTSLSVGSIQG